MDGIVCSVLLLRKLDAEEPLTWRDIVAYVGGFLLGGDSMNWFDRLIESRQSVCIICQSSVSRASATAWSHLLCTRCDSKIPWISPSDIQCLVCGRYEACPDCLRREDPQFILSRSAVRYDHVMKEWLGTMKYRGDERLSLLFAEMMRGAFERLLQELQRKPKQIACLTYVPLSDDRLAERGFNQTERIAQAIGAHYRIPVIPLLRRTRHTGKQSYKSRVERLFDLKGAFERNAVILPVATVTSPIILIDDVYTTGSTMNECAAALRSEEAMDVYGLTWAR